MSYAPIYNITNKSADGFDVTFSIKKKGASEPSTIPKLPLYGYRFTFNLSKYGLGLLNSKVTVDLLDDESDTFYNLFNNNLRNDIGFEIIHEDIGELFWGFADFQQLERILFEDNKRGIRVVFYNPSSWMQNIGYYTPAIQNQFVTDLGIVTGGSTSDLIWFADYFVKVAFRDYQNADRTCFIHRWIPQRSRFTGAMMPDRAMFNEICFNRLAFEDENISVADTIGVISRTFFFRYGWSIRHQAPAIVQLDSGFETGKYDLKQLDTPKIQVSTLGTDGFFIYDIDSTDNVPLPVINKDELQREVRALDVPPYISTTYSRTGADGAITPAQAAEFTQNNPNFTNPFLFDSYTASESPFDETSGTGTSVVFALSQSGLNSVLVSALGYFDETAFPSEVVQSTPSMNARLHMNIRQDIQKNIQGRYKGLLDPLIPHKSDFKEGIKLAEFTDLVEADGGFLVAPSHTGKVLTDLSDADTVCPCSAGAEGKLYFRNMTEKAYIITRGEYDLLRGETIIQESISLFEIEE